MKKHLSKIGNGALLGFLAAIVVWIVANYLASDIMYQYEARTYDWRVKKKIQDVKEAAIEEIVIIDIDGRSVSNLGKFSQWPRSYYPRLIENLNKGGARAIGLDIIFDKVIWQQEQDLQFVDAVKKAGNIYNALYFDKADTLNWRYEMKSEPQGFNAAKYFNTIHGKNIPEFRREERFENEFIELLNASSGNGHVNFNADEDGVVRSIHLFTEFNKHLYPSLGFKMYMDLNNVDSLVANKNTLALYTRGNLVNEIPVDEKGNMRINYFGSFKTFRYISFYDILENRVDSTYYKDKIFFVGTSLAGLYDLRNTPMLQAFPGVEIHANILKTLMDKQFVERINPVTTFVMMVVIGIFMGILMSYFTPLYSVILLVLSSVLYVTISALLFFESTLWVDIVTPVMTIFATFSIVYLFRFATEERKKRFIRSTFSHFVTKSVVDELLSNPEKIKLGGEKKECTVFFSDVAGFTTISEKLTPEALVSLLNDYLTQMTNIVFKYNGMLDKYEGDAIMAVFGAPVSQGNDAYNACAAALEMQETLIRMRALWRKQGRDELFARMGINTGPMVVGNMGSETRFDYTVMGDAVNLGARLEPANKQYGTDIMIGEETYKKAGDKIIVRQLDLLRVKGKTAPVKVYELVGLQGKGIDDKKARVLDLFQRGFDQYLQQNWDWAINYFEQALSADRSDEPCQRYIKRCKVYKANPPGEKWDGVFVMQTK
ncbi:MAG: CHASE2 domain-containing protein [Calditrichaeota bacterium]|nr:CHASE2 domain-containing protein [Calditrichota bacterium]